MLHTSYMDWNKFGEYFMYNIRYASMNEYDLLVSQDSHIRKEEWKRLIENNQALIFYVDNDFAGWLRWNLFWDEIPFMNMLYFPEEYRGKGYGTQMVKFWENEMVKLGYDKVMTSSQANESAQHFYRKLGYWDAGSFFPFCEDLEIIFTKEL